MAVVGNIAKIPELRNRVVFTLLMLGIYRLGVYVPAPGVDTKALENILKQGTVFDIFNLFSGGALENFSVFALGIMPYISASIILQLLTIAVPAIEQLKKEGEAGHRKITQYTRYGTLVLSMVQGFGISYGLAQQGVLLPGVGGLGFYLLSMLTLATGTAFLMWLGEQITERGIGNGISMIIFAGIVARVPASFRAAWAERGQYGELLGFILLLGLIFAIIGAIVYFERSFRRIPVQYAKRVVGRKLYGGQESHLPLKINMAGVIPPIFAQSLILFPSTIAQFAGGGWMQELAQQLNAGWIHHSLYAVMIVFFTFFYTAVAFNPVDVAENIQKHGGYIPGIRPGKATSDYLDRILSRITVGGALYITLVCLLPQILTTWMKVPPGIAFTFGGTSLLIMVGVAMDTVSQMEAHLLSHHYEGVLGQKGGATRFRGRRG
ncbi:MAG: preprotein translocase subunit SecY [Deltaproteobacteria bacterium]|nr:preprotein translocase subunit SecY [Deltaproteobacteria bacterium]